MIHKGIIHKGIVHKGIMHKGIVHKGIVHKGIVHKGIVHKGIVHKGIMHKGIVHKDIKITATNPLLVDSAKCPLFWTIINKVHFQSFVNTPRILIGGRSIVDDNRESQIITATTKEARSRVSRQKGSKRK
jgi:hypothetical protein